MVKTTIRKSFKYSQLVVLARAPLLEEEDWYEVMIAVRAHA